MSYYCAMSNKPAKNNDRGKRLVFLQVTGLILISAAVYVNTLWNGFVFDDNTQLLRNLWIRDWGNIPDIFKSNVWAFSGGTSSYYRPVMHLIYMLGYHLFGPMPWGFHLLNVLLNTAVCLLVFSVTSRLLRDSDAYGDGASYVPFLSAAIFAVHPVHSEAVAWVAGVPDLSYALFYLLSFYFYMVYRSGGGRAGLSVFFSLASFLIAMLCKEPAVTLPAVLFVYDYAVRKDKDGLAGYTKRYLPYAAALAVYFVMRHAALRGISSAPYWKLGPYQVVVNIPPLLGQYMEMALLPVNLNVSHPFHPVSSLFSPAALIGAAASASFALALFLSFKKRSVWAMGLVLFAAPLLPSLYIAALGKNVFCERYLYLPISGLALLAGLLYAHASVRMPALRKVLVVFTALLVTVYSAGTISRNTVWADDITLWSDSAKKAPGNPYAHLGLGTAYVKKGWLDEAIRENNCALSQSLDDKNVQALAHSNLGSVYATAGQLDRAKEELGKVMAVDPMSAEAHCVLGAVYKREGRLAEAKEELNRAIELSPVLPDAHSNLGIIYGMEGRMDKALEHSRLAVELAPESLEFHDNLGIVYSMAGINEEALKQFNYVLKINPLYPKAHNNLGMAYANMGQMDKAIREFEAALKLDPDNALLRENLRRAYESAPGGVPPGR